MKFAGALEQDAFAFEIGGIGDTAIYGAYGGAGFMIVEADALGALRRDDVVDILRDCGARRAVQFPWNSARINRRVGAFGLAGPAVDTFARDSRRHLVTGPQLNDVFFRKAHRALSI